MNLKDFYKGNLFDCYNFFGAHKENDEFIFRTYAPAAKEVMIFGSFNDWKEEEMKKDEGGIFLFKTNKTSFGDMYKYVIYSKDGHRYEHCDPYGFGMELRPAFASYITDSDEYRFTDERWLKNRTKNFNSPMNIYELHLGSWKTHNNQWYNYSELADILILNRRKRGAPEIETSESKLIIDNGMCREIVPRTRGKSEMIIEEFMLTANEAAARTAHENDIPFVYRVHEAPSPEKINDLKEGLRRLNVEVPVFTEAKPVHLSEILRNSKDKPFYPVINMMTLRSMAKAKYEPEPKGHFGLALDDYAHFTSPIRRYPDLAIHRILTDIINGYDKEKLIKRYSGFVQKASQRSTETEIRAMNIERNCEDCYKAEYMQQHIGEIFKGLISSVTEYGFYVELENTVEGLVHVNSLPEGNYIYDGFFSLTEEFSNTVYSVGTKVSVLCAGADVNSGKIDFNITDNKE